MSSSKNLATLQPLKIGSDDQRDVKSSGVDYPVEKPERIVRDEKPTATQQFLQRYRKKYGCENEPPFFTGSLQEAMTISLSSQKERLLLAIYLHNENSIAVNIFVTNVLLDKEVRTLLAGNFLLWPWDCATAEEQNELANHLSGAIPDVEHGVREIPRDSFPCIFIYDKKIPSYWPSAQFDPIAANQNSGWGLRRPAAAALNKPEIIKLTEINGGHNKEEVSTLLMECMEKHWRAVDQESEEHRIHLEDEELLRRALEESLALEPRPATPIEGEPSVALKSVEMC